MKVLDILKRAEDELREAIAESARAGDYRSVDIGRSVAVNIKEIYESISRDGQIVSRRIKVDDKTKHKKKGKTTYKRNKPEGLPRFEIRNGSLFKIGWSRKHQSKYSHKVPHSAFESIIDAMSKLRKEGRGPFAGETVIEKINTATEDNVPAYQVYVVLGALRAMDVISQVGREGYDIPVDILEKARDVWGRLAVK